MKCRACFRWVPDDANSCSHCGAGLTTTGPKLRHTHDGHGHHHGHDHKPEEKKEPPASKEAAAAAVAKIKALLTAPKPDKKQWARNIVERHARGDKSIAPYALKSARDALGIREAEEAASMAAVEEELRQRGVIRVPGQDDDQPQSTPVANSR